MTSFHVKLEEWIISETHLLSDRCLKLFPETSVFCRLIEGKNKKIWKYVVDHVRSRHTAEKARRILRVKRSQDEPENPYPVTDADQILKRIAKAEEKRSFLERSLSELKREIASTEDVVRSMDEKVCTLNQKSAILELIIAEYNKKFTFLNSIQYQLTSYVARNSKQNAQFYLALNFPLTHKKAYCNNSNFGDNHVSNKVKYVLKHVYSSVVDSKGEISRSSNENLMQHVNQMMDIISLADLIILLKEASNASYMELMSNETYSSNVEVQSLNIKQQNSEKYLQVMKLQFIQSSFAAKKAKKETLCLQEEKESLLRKFKLHSDDAVLEKKFEVFEKMAENLGIGESIKFLEDTLNNEQNEAKMLKEDTNGKTAASGNLEAAVKKFYSNFDTLCRLLKSGSHIHDYIIKSLLKLHTFTNQQMFSNVTPTLIEYPLQMKQILTFDIQTLWSVLDKNNIINPLIPRLPSFGSVMPESLMMMLDVSRFENECVIDCKVKKTKDQLSSNQDGEFMFGDDGLSNVHEQYCTLIETLQKMQDKLESCSRNFRETSEHNQRVQVVLRDWWEQGAQFIPQIECEDKSLKMWLDILLVLPDV